MLKKLDRYLLWNYIRALLVVTLAVGLTIIVINMVEELRDFIDHRVPILSIFEYYLFFGGWVLKSFFPFFILLATLFSVSLLGRKNELMAMKASGLSLYRLTLPFFVATVIMAAGHFYYNEFIFPPANKRRLELKQFTIEKRSKEYFARTRNIYRQISRGNFFTIGTFNISTKRGEDFKLYKTTKDQLEEIVTAREILYQKSEWYAIKGVRRFFDSTKASSFTEFDTLAIPSIKEKPDDFARPLGDPDDMGLEELQKYIDLMKRTGAPYLREEIDLQLKYSYPLSSVIILFITIPFAANTKRSGIAVSIASGSLIALLYFVLFRVSQSAGYNGRIPEEAAIWGVNGLFLFVGIILMLKARK